ncbi:MAG: MoaD/ThiS family protein [Verrucomicrobiota bacterium]
MRIHLEFAAVMDLKGAASGQALELAGGSTIADLMNHLKVKPQHQKFVVPFVNGEKKRPSAPLHENDRVFLSLPIGGG